MNDTVGIGQSKHSFDLKDAALKYNLMNIK